MEKECIVKYITVLNDGRNRDDMDHPHRHILNYNKQDELCCDDMKASIIKFIYEGVYEENNAENIGVYLYADGKEMFKSFKYCPFCSSKIIYKETEKMKYVNRPVDNWVLVSEECETDEPLNDD